MPATVPVWSGRVAWFDALKTALATPAGEATRADQGPIKAATVLDVATEDARAADSGTGRNLTTAHATVAKILGCSMATVRRARAVIEALGFARTVERGRYLTAAERANARAQHGGTQLRMASRRCLTVPRPQRNEHLPRRGPVLLSLPSRSDSPKRARPRAGAAARPAKNPRPKQRHRSRPSIEVQRLAARLAQRLPWLARGHIGSLCHTLAVLGLDDTGWTAQDVLDLMDHRNIALGLYSVTERTQRDPLALLAHQLRSALATVDEPPRARRTREAAAAAARQQRARAQQVAEQAQLAAERADPAAQARITEAKRQIRAHIARARRQGSSLR